MMNLTFGEQVKIILGRKGMTIKELAEQVEAYTGKPMSRQNMTQRLGRDNFQEQDMRMIAEILGCKLTLSLMDSEEVKVEVPVQKQEEPQAKVEIPKEPEPKVEINWADYAKETKPEVVEPIGEINPYTQKEYETNSVRMHPKRIGYVQVYDREQHKWSDMTEWAFLGYQERQKKQLGKSYKPPIYLD